MINKNTHDDIYQHEQNLRNKAAGYVISRYLFEIKKYKTDPTKPRPTEDDFYELIKDIASNDKQFQKFTFDSYRIRICYNKEKDIFYLECYSY
ncbi:MAG TPA: hypothetical protein VHJ38_05150 [Nitrososphaeraceae archaeon]|nr:hypothetical protein [Nitrososphaeraceae archaeon]